VGDYFVGQYLKRKAVHKVIVFIYYLRDFGQFFATSVELNNISRSKKSGMVPGKFKKTGGSAEANFKGYRVHNVVV
jgi:hypothetical protein